MSDDLTKTSIDGRTIALAQAYEVRDWCKALNCTKEELTEAVKAVGNSAQKVREYLSRNPG